jgi:cysteine-rich repeat protein
VVTATVTVTMEIAGVGTAALSGASTLTSTTLYPQTGLSLTVGLPSPMLRVADYPVLGYELQSSFGPLVIAGPFLSQVAQPSDLGDIILNTSSAVTFEAVTTCGNGMLDAGEACDDGNTSSADCCAPSCEFASAGTTCRQAATPCDATEVCTGASAICPPDGARADGASCFSFDICSAGAGACQSGTCVAGPRDCDDHVPCTQDSCDQTLGCVHVAGPQAGCLTAPKSKLLLAPVTAGQAMLSWRWANGAALALGDLSDPAVDASYELCVYSGAPDTLIAQATFPAGAQWSAAGAEGYRYRQLVPKTVVRLRSGVAGKSSAVVKGCDVDLEQAFPFTAPVTVQLRKVGSPLCLESRFQSLQRSDSTRLTASTP